MNLNLVTLKNNLKVLFINSEGQKIATTQFWFKAGSALEGPENLGIAHFLEHMLFKGTKKRPNGKIAKDVEAFGGDLNAFTSFNYTCYYINSPINHLKESVGVLLDMISAPIFLEKDLEPERGVVLEEFKRSIDSPSQYLFKELQELAFPKGFNHSILGTEKTIKNFSRSQLISFFEKYYGTENALLVVAGDLTNREDELSNYISKFKIKKSQKTSFNEFLMSQRPSLSIHEKDTEQGQILLTYQGLKYNELSSIREDLAINTLGNGEMSRLYKQLVTKTTLATSCNFSTMYLEEGSAHILKVTFPLNKTQNVLKEVYKTLKDVVNTPFTEQEISRIKNLYISSKIYEKESIESFAFSMGYNYALAEDVHAENKFIDQMKTLSPSSVYQSLTEILQRPAHIAVQLPKGAKEKYQTHFKTFAKNLATIRPKKTLKKSAIKLKSPIKTSSFDENTKVYELKPGIKFLCRYSPQTPTFALHFYIQGGIAQESLKTNGSHNLISSLLTKGSGKVSYEKLQNILDDKTASLSGISGKNTYGLTLHGKSEDTETLFNLFMDSVFDPQMPEKFLKHEKEMCFRYLKNQEKDPVKQCLKSFTRINYEGHHYQMDVIGQKESLSKITRTQLKALHKKNLTSNPIIISYCGPFSPEQIFEIISPSIEKLPKRSKKFTTPKNTSKNLKTTSLKIPFDREQTHIFIGRQGFHTTHKNEHFSKILSAYLSGQASPLFTKMRDQLGLCYTVQPINFLGIDGGHFGIYIASSTEKASNSIYYINNFLKKLGSKGPKLKEFNATKKLIEGHTLLGLVTNDDYASAYSIAELNNFGFDYLYQINKKIEETTLDEFNDFLKDFVETNWQTIIVGRED